MISHVFVGTNDFERALPLYLAVMDALELQLKFCDVARPWAGWIAPSQGRPLFVLARPHDSAAATVGNGQMVALLAPSRAAVERAHAAALRNGGRCDGAPGLRPHYHPDYFGAYFRDVDGNKIGIACHDPA